MRKGGIIGLVFLFAAVACSVHEHYRALSFFFDGVPNLVEIRQAAIADSLKSVSKDTLAMHAQVTVPKLFIHQPYFERKCDNCHNQGSMGSLDQLMPELCYQCHTKFSTQFQYEHGPSVGGYCTQCHHPHQSKEENLLKRTGKELCLYCHDAALLAESPFHNHSEETDCISCHNPHGSNNHSLLKPGSCYRCHENFTQKYAVVHSPVAGEYCTACHLPHSAGTGKLLARTGRELCLYCHEEGFIMANKNHKDTEEASCTDCHNPHGGNDKFILN